MAGDAPYLPPHPVNEPGLTTGIILQMKKTLFASAFALAALVSAPAFAQATGFVGASASHTEVDAFGFEGESQGLALGGSVAAPVGGLTLQVDGALSDSEDSDVGTSVAAHLAAGLGAGRVGAFVGVSELGGEDLWTVGVEGQAFTSDQLTLAGTLAYFGAEQSDVDGWGVGGQARYFVSDNFRVDGTLGYVDADAGFVNVDGWTAGVGAEYQLAGSPLSVFGGYTHADIEDLDLKSDTFSIGVRYNFGADLKQRDRSGASLPGASAILAGLPL